LKTLSKNDTISLISQKIIDGFNIIYKGQFYTFKFKESTCGDHDYGLLLRGNQFCPNQSNRNFEIQGSNHFIERLSSYFRSSKSADALVFAASEVTFEENQMGGHGGFSNEEMEILVLLKNASASNKERQISIENLLGFANPAY
jgi:hypothetical protein